MAINLREHISNMKGERYIASIIYGEANCGKTKFIKNFILKNHDINIAYFDFMEELDKLNDKSQIILFSPKSFVTYFREILKSISSDVNAVILDNFDVVINRWDSTKKIEFVNQMTLLDKNTINIPIIAFVQTDPIFEENNNKQINNKIQTIFNFRELEAI